MATVSRKVVSVQRLEAVTVRGYTSIRDARVELGDLNVLVGANGSGKSNFVTALELLGRIVEERLGAFVSERGASELLHNLRSPIELEASFEQNLYRAVLGGTHDDKLIFRSETTGYRGSPAADWTTRVLGREHRETLLHQRAEAKGSRASVERYVIDMLRGCRVYHFHDTSAAAPIKSPVPTADNVALRPDAGNLAAMLWVIREGSPATYRQVVGAVRQVAPFFGGFVLEPEITTDKIRLRWRHEDSDRVFSAHQLSDGTLRFISLTTLLLDTGRLPALVVLDEPELGLHPFAIVQLAEMLRAAAVTSQVVVATQSVTLIDQVELTDLIVVDREHGASTFTRPPLDQLGEWLDDYSVGELWQKALIGGRPSRETR